MHQTRISKIATRIAKKSRGATALFNPSQITGESQPIAVEESPYSVLDSLIKRKMDNDAANQTKKPTDAESTEPHELAAQEDAQEPPTLTDTTADEYHRGWLECKLDYFNTNADLIKQIREDSTLAHQLLTDAQNNKDQTEQLNQLIDRAQKSEKHLKRVSHLHVHMIKRIDGLRDDIINERNEETDIREEAKSNQEKAHQALMSKFNEGIKKNIARDKSVRSQMISSIRHIRTQTQECQKTLKESQSVKQNLESLISNRDSIYQDQADAQKQVLDEINDLKQQILADQKNIQSAIAQQVENSSALEELQAASNNFIDEQKEQTAEQHQQLTRLAASIEDTITKSSQYEQQISTLIQQESELKSIIHQDQSKFQRLIQETENTIIQINQSKQGIDAVCKQSQAQLQALEHANQQYPALLEDMVFKLQQLDYAKQSVTTEIDRLKEQQVSADTQIKHSSELNQELNQVKDYALEDLNQLEIKISQAEALLETLNEQQAAQQHKALELGQLKFSLQSTEAKINDTHTQAQLTLNTNQDLVKELKSQQNNNKQAEEAIRAESNELKTRHKEFSSKLDHAQLILDELDKEKSLAGAKLKKSIQTLKTQQELSEQIEKQTQTQKTLEHTTQNLQDTITQEYQTLSSLKDTLEKERTDYSRSINDHQKNLEVYREKLAHNETLNQQLAKALEQAQSHNQSQSQVQEIFNSQLEKIENYQQRAFQEHEQQRNHTQQLITALKAAEQNNQVLAKQFEQVQHLHQDGQANQQRQHAQLEQVQQQHADLEKQLHITNQQNQMLKELLKTAAIDRRETKLSSQEAQHANQQTRLILTELKQEIKAVKGTLPASDGRINALEQQLLKPQPPHASADTQSPTLYDEPQTKIQAHTQVELDNTGGSIPTFKRFMM